MQIREIRVKKKSCFILSSCLIEKGAKVNSRDTHGDTPLMSSVETGEGGRRGNRVNMVALLLEIGANPNLAVKRGETALSFARKAFSEAEVPLRKYESKQVFDLEVSLSFRAFVIFPFHS